ncbi:MAG: ATP-binding protein [Negativicutes bacterium]|nr:ATP-binding protein [Negativicutes bacterium]MDR3592841.1 ATP-binding protein [Negativicutes bacterium]
MIASLPAIAPSEQDLASENLRLRRELGEANSILDALRSGEVDALLLSGEDGDRAYVLDGADHIYRTIVEQMQEGYVTLDADGTILFCNQNFATMIKTPLDNIIGTSFYSSLSKTPDQRTLSRFLTTAEGCLKTELYLRSGDGQGVPVLVSANHIKMEDGSFACMVMTDLSERKRFEDEMAHLDRLNIVGEMAAGIGHEIRNPLTTVRGYLQIIRRKEKYAEHWEQFGTMIEELDRANAIISEYLSLAKNKVVELKPGNLNHIVNALFPLLQADAFSIGHTVILETGNLPDIELDAKEIRQLVLNLFRNGLEAMQPGGTVTIKTYQGNSEVILAVCDTGTGVPKEVMDKLGTPFLTTKEKGTGLGLAVSYRIAQRHGAKINVKSSAKGTTFFVKFKY